MRVRFYENNSGGHRWLEEPQWTALREAGWTLFVHNLRRNRNERVEMHDGRNVPYALSPEVKSVRSAIKQWEDITEQDADEEGCNCCGPPYNFSEESEEDARATLAAPMHVPPPPPDPYSFANARVNAMPRPGNQ